MVNLSPSDANALVELRAMLEQARQSSRNTASIARLASLVLLDAVNERVVHLSAQVLPTVSVKDRDTLEDLYARVRQALGSSLTPNSGWVDVRKLHRARNSAQHEGLGSDPSLLPGWVAATERFARAIVLATFQVTLDQVHLADAILETKLSNGLRSAESKLAAGAIADAFDELVRVFASAFGQWIGQHKRAAHGPFQTPFRHKYKEFKDLQKTIDDLSNTAAAQALAADPAEYVWFADLRSSSQVSSITVEECRRALAFVFWWVVHWEAINATLVPQHVRHLQSIEQEVSTRTRKTVTPARIGSVSSEPSWTPDKYRLVFEIQDVPPYGDHFDMWASALRKRVDSMQVPSTTNWYFDSACTVSTMADLDVNTDDVVTSLGQVLLQVEEDVTASQERASHKAAELQESRDEFYAELASCQERIPSWIEEIYLADQEDGVGIMQSRLRIQVTEAVLDAVDIGKLLRDREEINAAYSGQGRQFHIAPELPPSRFFDICDTLDAEVSAALESHAVESQRRQQDVNQLNARLAESVRRHTGM